MQFSHIQNCFLKTAYCMVTSRSTSVMDHDKNSFFFCYSWPVLNFTTIFWWCSLWHDGVVSLHTLAQGRGTWRYLCFLLIVDVYMYSHLVTCMKGCMCVCTYKYIYTYIHICIYTCTIYLWGQSLYYFSLVFCRSAWVVAYRASLLYQSCVASEAVISLSGQFPEAKLDIFK